MTEVDTSKFWDKDSKRPEYRELYERLPFIEAYAKHTDMRIAEVGPELAIGSTKGSMTDWDSHGSQQLEYLKYEGMKPEHTLLDIGCGTGRLACKAVPYLATNNYTGIDISYAAIENCLRLSKAEGWGSQYPVFITGDGSLSRVKLFRFDYIFAHSVFTHLPPDIIEQIFQELAIMDFGRFFFTHKTATENKRTGLKQFCYDPNWFKTMASPHGIIVEPARCEFPSGQHVMKAWKR